VVKFSHLATKNKGLQRIFLEKFHQIRHICNRKYFGREGGGGGVCVPCLILAAKPKTTFKGTELTTNLGADSYTINQLINH
jgi:hypothetical protein